MRDLLEPAVPVGLLLGALAAASCAAREPADVAEPVELAGSTEPAEPVAPAQPMRQVFAAHAEPGDEETLRALTPLLMQAGAAVEAFFGRPFPELFEVLLLPDRAAFEASFPPEWGLSDTQCWMVAAGVADGMHLLTPRVWRTQACEHDPDDEDHVRELLAHELVHVFHGQSNPTRDFDGTSGIDWFVEGLATFASGQLEREHRGAARDALANGQGPEALADAWTGRYRYGVCGSLVEHLDRRVGREALIEMLGATTLDEILELAGTSEGELLEEWRASVLAPGADAK